MKKIVIMGAGISGLAVGCYLQMNGYETEIFEKHNMPGGLCTSWTRGEYHFDGCIHWLLGSGKGNSFYKLWSELINMEDIKFVNHDVRVSIEVKKNTDRYKSRVLNLYSDSDKLKKYLLDLSPEDHAVINEFIDAINYIKKYELPPMADKAPQVRGIADWFKMLKYIPLLGFLKKWMITNKDFAKKLKNSFLKEAFELLYDGMEFPMLSMVMQLSFYGSGFAGYPTGGSLSFAKRIEKRYLALGGNIHYNSEVNKIITEDNKAVAVQIKDKQIVKADIVISAADWKYTVFHALEGKYVDKTINSLSEQKKLEVFDSALLISIGVSKQLDHVAHLLRFPLEEAWQLEDGSRYERMEAHIYNYDKTLAPEGKTVITVTMTNKNADFWIDLRQNNYKKYTELKKSIADKVINILEKKLDIGKDNVDVADVATPATFYRYTGNWKGSMQGWMPVKLFAASPVKNTLPGLKNFYMTGHWLEPGGGLPIALMSGRNLAQVLCKQDKKKFHTDYAAGFINETDYKI